MKKVSKKKEAVQLDLQAPVDVAPESAMQVKDTTVEPAQLSLFQYYQHRMEREASK